MALQWDEQDAWHMARALELAARGEGLVEPNPMVGCTLVRDGETVGEGFHTRFGAPHAEIEALQVAGHRARGATAYVTLEPCCHHGKTPPCSKALIAAGVRRVVIAQKDPFPRVAGGGMVELDAAGIEVEVGLRAEEACRLNAPYLKLIRTGRPWVIAKWAMTLDGKIATHTGDSRWISSPASRQIVHGLRGRVDAVVVGRGTAQADDPLLTARPAGLRAASRIVVDTQASLLPTSRLAQTAHEAPVIVAIGENAPPDRVADLAAAGCELLMCSGDTREARLDSLLDQLGARRMTNILVEGGGQLLGSLFDARQIDEVHVFVAPKLIGGAAASGPMAGQGVAMMAQAVGLSDPIIQQFGTDVYIHGRVNPA
jgi:diaminohydroxyphosphoribosylaminopyrimidine deaminase/5-amino-6-(5-phosphoribosylamino)uracil reductase